jgi:hypothetical protein
VRALPSSLLPQPSSFGLQEELFLPIDKELSFPI